MPVLVLVLVLACLLDWVATVRSFSNRSVAGKSKRIHPRYSDQTKLVLAFSNVAFEILLTELTFQQQTKQHTRMTAQGEARSQT